MSADERALLDAYLLWLAKEGARDIERGDFIVARTREEFRRILWDGWRPSSQEGEIEAAGPAGARRAHCPKETSASLLAA